MKVKITCAVLLVAAGAQAQQSLTMEESIQYALKNNQQIKADEYNVQSYQQLKRTHTEIGKTMVSWTHGQFNSLNKDNNITVSQTIPFPTVLAEQAKLGEAHTEGARLNLSVSRNELIYQVGYAYLQLSYQKSLHQLLLSQDSLYSGFARASVLRYQTGESNLLEKTTAETQAMEVRNQIIQNDSEIMIYKNQLQTLLNCSEPVDSRDPLSRYTASAVDSTMLSNNPLLRFTRQQVAINRQNKKVEQGRFLPDLTIGYFSQSLIGYQQVNNSDVFFDRSKKFTGIQLGVALPLWFVPQAGKAKAAYYNEVASQKKYEYMHSTLRGELTRAQQDLKKNQINLDYYETSALKNSRLILYQAQKAYQAGEISYLEYLMATKNAHAIRFNYLTALLQYNHSVLRLKYLSGEN